MDTAHDASRFDRHYFNRFYIRPETRASEPEEFARLAAFVLGYLDYLDIPLRNVLDLGCGLGRWKPLLKSRDPKIDYTGVDPSPYLCREYGWIRSSVEEFQSKQKYDLVICQDVLPYLSSPSIRNALSNIARLCRGAAYLQIITKEDWDNDVCDPDRTDASMHRFEAAWYRKCLGRRFINCGGGVFLPKESDVVVWELEHC